LGESKKVEVSLLCAGLVELHAVCSLSKGSLKLVLECMKCSRNHELVYPVYLVEIRCF
jgi:hypothetical protein